MSRALLHWYIRENTKNILLNHKFYSEGKEAHRRSCKLYSKCVCATSAQHQCVAIICHPNRSIIILRLQRKIGTTERKLIRWKIKIYVVNARLGQNITLTNLEAYGLVYSNLLCGEIAQCLPE